MPLPSLCGKTCLAGIPLLWPNQVKAGPVKENKNMPVN